MSINPKDDYNALGSLFYPSIEASGNAYYGQTRKLAIDELFNTNNSGFLGCIVARPLGSDKKYFSWELGPLKGCLKVFNDFYDSDNIYFAKYNVKVKNNEPIIYDVINSGQFPTYSKNVYIELDKDQPYVIGAINPVTINDPEKAEAWDGRNFYVDVDKKILYIAIAKDSLKKEITKAMTYPSQEELEQPLTFTNSSDSPKVIHLYKPYHDTYPDENLNTFQYRILDESDNVVTDWTDQTNYSPLTYSQLNAAADGKEEFDDAVVVQAGYKIQYRLNIASEYISIPDYRNYGTQFGTNGSPGFVLSGNIASMIDGDVSKFSVIKDSSAYQNCHQRMFEDCKGIVSAKDLIIPYETISDELVGLFGICTSLKYAPYIHVKNVIRDKHGNPGDVELMFYDCHSLIEPPPIIPIVDYDKGASSLCYHMFSRCTNLHKAPLMPLVECTFNALINMFDGCSELTQMPVIISSELNNLSSTGELYRGNKSFQNAFTGTKIKAIYCAATSDSNPSSKPKLSEWLPIDMQKIYVPSNCPPDFWESADEAYAGKIVKINDEMDANEYPQYWTKPINYNIASYSYNQLSYTTAISFSPEYIAYLIDDDSICVQHGVAIAHSGPNGTSSMTLGSINNSEQLYIQTENFTLDANTVTIKSSSVTTPLLSFQPIQTLDDLMRQIDHTYLAKVNPPQVTIKHSSDLYLNDIVVEDIMLNGELNSTTAHTLILLSSKNPLGTRVIFTVIDYTAQEVLASREYAIANRKQYKLIRNGLSDGVFIVCSVEDRPFFSMPDIYAFDNNKAYSCNFGHMPLLLGSVNNLFIFQLNGEFAMYRPVRSMPNQVQLGEKIMSIPSADVESKIIGADFVYIIDPSKFILYNGQYGSIIASKDTTSGITSNNYHNNTEHLGSDNVETKYKNTILQYLQVVDYLDTFYISFEPGIYEVFGCGFIHNVAYPYTFLPR